MLKKALWGGFCNGRLDSWLDRDAYGFCVRFAIFKTRAEAAKQYEDVRRIEIREVKRRRVEGKANHG